MTTSAVRQTLGLSVCLVLFTALCSAAQGGAGGAKEGEKFLGAWSGTWAGGGSGGFDLTLEKGAEGALGGKVAVTGGPTYNATLKTVSFESNKMTARYDFPEDEGIEVVLVATFDGKTATGTWSAREKGAGSEVATGTWTVTKK